MNPVFFTVKFLLNWYAAPALFSFCMLAFFTITFRETLEAGLVVFIILSYLRKVHQKKYHGVVYSGAVSAVAVSALFAWILSFFVINLEGDLEKIFEGSLMVTAVVLLTTMLFWMARTEHVRHQLTTQGGVELSDHHVFGLFALTFTAVLREAVEAVLFVTARSFQSTQSLFTGSLLGLVGAIFVLHLFSYGAQRLPLKHFFRATSLLLIFFAASLLGDAVHEFQELGWVPFGAEEEMNPVSLAVAGFYCVVTLVAYHRIAFATSKKITPKTA